MSGLRGTVLGEKGMERSLGLPRVHSVEPSDSGASAENDHIEARAYGYIFVSITT